MRLRAYAIVDARIINAPSPTKNGEGECDPQVHRTRKCKHRVFGMKACIGADEHSGRVQHAHCTAANVGDVTQMQHLLHGCEEEVYSDSGYTGAENRAELQDIKAAFLIGADACGVRRPPKIE